MTTKSDGLYVFVLLHRHFLVEPQKRSQGWSYPVEVQADAWRSPPGIAFKPFFPAQALMATNRALRSSRRGQVLRFLAEGNHLHRLSTPVPDPVPTDHSPCNIHPADGEECLLSLTWGTGEGQETTDGTHPTWAIASRTSSQALLPQETVLTIFPERTEHQALGIGRLLALFLKPEESPGRTAQRPILLENKGRSCKATASASGITGPVEGSVLFFSGFLRYDRWRRGRKGVWDRGPLDQKDRRLFHCLPES